MKTTWDDRADQIAEDLWPTNSAGQISAQLRAEGYAFSANAVIGRLHRRGVTCKQKTKIHPTTRHDIVRPIGFPVVELTPVVSKIKLKKKPEPKPEPFICRDASEVEPLNISLLDLESHHCRWPYGAAPEVAFCGHPKQNGSSYCAPHWKLSIGHGTPSERAAEKIGAAA